MTFSDFELVAREYACEDRFRACRRAHKELREGVDAEDVIVAALAEASPARILEVGCGLGELAARIGRELRRRVVTLDLSPRMAELSRERGVDARLGDVQDLPFGEDEFDCVVAAWMLYHVPDLVRGLEEIVRVLRPGGRLVESTLAEDNLLALWRALGGESPPRDLSFSRENGQAQLARHFSEVELREAPGAIVFPTQASICEYVEAMIAGRELGDLVPTVAVPFRAASDQVVFVATKAA